MLLSPYRHSRFKSSQVFFFFWSCSLLALIRFDFFLHENVLWNVVSYSAGEFNWPLAGWLAAERWVGSTGNGNGWKGSPSSKQQRILYKFTRYSLRVWYGKLRTTKLCKYKLNRCSNTFEKGNLIKRGILGTTGKVLRVPKKHRVLFKFTRYSLRLLYRKL